jgi:glutamine synthetase
MKKKYDPKEPVNFNVDNLTNEELAKLNIRELPRNFEKALKGFEKSDFIRKVLGKEMKELFVQLKRRELNNYKKAIDTGNERKWEIDNYLDC